MSVCQKVYLKTPSVPVGRQARRVEGCVCRNRQKKDQMLKQVQHDKMVRFWSCCHPELVSGSRSGIFALIEIYISKKGGCQSQNNLIPQI